MRKITAKRKTQRKCIYCNEKMFKGQVYYIQRDVWVDGYNGKVRASEYIVCSKCKYRNKEHKERYEEYKEKCEHNRDFIETSYIYIPGECVQEPDYQYCRLCGNKV